MRVKKCGSRLLQATSSLIFLEVVEVWKMRVKKCGSRLLQATSSLILAL